MTTLAVIATAIVALKWLSSMNRVISAAIIRNMYGMKNDNQNDEDFRLRWIERIKVSDSTPIEKLVTVNLTKSVFSAVHNCPAFNATESLTSDGSSICF